MVKKTDVAKFSKTAFLDAEDNTNERHLLEVLLGDEKTYAIEEVAKIVKQWKSKEAK